MSPNRSDHRSSPRGPQHNAGVVFNRMSRYIGRLAKSTATSDVHRFRTNSRRVEALIEELVPPTRNKKKLLKLLSKLRKRAGRLRDLDVQILFLDSLKIPDRQNHRAQLLEWFAAERTRRARKLVKGFDRETIQELRKRLRRTKSEMKLDRVDPLKMAFNRLPKPGTLPLSEPSLHACRIASKQARYLAELALDSADAKFMVEELKRAQDVIGEWHDVLKLKERAEQRFGSVSDSALVSALQNISRARFRRATSALLAALAAISERQKSSTTAPVRKGSESDSQAKSAAVA